MSRQTLDGNATPEALLLGKLHSQICQTMHFYSMVVWTKDLLALKLSKLMRTEPAARNLKLTRRSISGWESCGCSWYSCRTSKRSSLKRRSRSPECFVERAASVGPGIALSAPASQSTSLEVHHLHLHIWTLWASTRATPCSWSHQLALCKILQMAMLSGIGGICTSFCAFSWAAPPRRD